MNEDEKEGNDEKIIYCDSRLRRSLAPRWVTAGTTAQSGGPATAIAAIGIIAPTAAAVFVVKEDMVTV